MDKIISALRTLFLNAISSGSGEFAKIVSVYYGKPIKIPESSLPAIAISPVETLFVGGGNKISKRECIVEATLIFNASDYFKESPTDAKKVYAVEAGIKMTELITNNQGIDSNSLVGVIMSNIRLPYDDNGQTRNACDFCLPESVRYELRLDGAFPTYEIVVRLKARLVGDRN